MPGKNVLITGGAGFLGRGIMKYWPENQYTVYSRDETKQDEAKRKYGKANYILGDVTDPDRLWFACAKYAIDTIIHAAAIKYIPEAELNVTECIDVNVAGSRNVCEVASRCGLDTVIGISTDKAVLPVNTYGASKMLMERIFGEYATLGSTRFVLTRYGNVVGSTGSVIPMFLRQIAERNGIRLTDPDMTRFWISVAQAVQLVRLAANAPNGYMVVPKAQAMTMHDLVGALVEGTGAKIEVIGPRPGEKKHEHMVHSYESVRAWDCGDHYEVGPVGSKAVRDEFVLSSNNPEVWLDGAGLREMMEQAECV